MTTKSSSSEILNDSTPIKNSNSSSSRYLPTVSLEDWWLLISEDGKRLCIGGLVFSENRAKRVFFSAPITKRHSLMSLKTADGINVLVQGPINNSQQNGFSSEVCSRFIVGFPCGCEDVVDRCLGQEFAGNGAPTSSMSSFAGESFHYDLCINQPINMYLYLFIECYSLLQRLVHLNSVHDSLDKLYQNSILYDVYWCWHVIPVSEKLSCWL
ncbi:hypothetical protein MKX03_019088 [Papaver bracteatum]|nr:hypothetical protein MKX03_019088 [Papaver bracteatum]